MTTGVLAQALLTLALIVIFLGFLVWGIRTGQFRNVEEPKYRIFEKEDGGVDCMEEEGPGEGRK